MNSYEMILCIVNAGFSELVMDAAKEVGARGGTLIHARGTANREAEQFFNIAIQPDKDLILILVPSEIKDNVLHAIYRNAGLKSEGKGIAFSIPVDDVIGVSASFAKVDPDEKEEPEKQPEQQEDRNTEN